MKKSTRTGTACHHGCTMAMAVEVNTPTTPGNSTSDYAYSVTLYPGKSIIFDKADLGMTDVSDDDVKAGKYNVDITFERGADFIASKGWVKTATGYRYVLTAKDSVVAIDGTPDIIISAIKVTKVGQNETFYSAQYTDKLADGTATYATHTKDGKPTVTAQDFKPMKDIADSTNGIALCLGFDFGYEPGKIVIAKDGKSVTPDAFVENTLYSVVRTQEANAKSSVTLGKYATTENPFGYTYTLKAGETVMFANIGNVNIDNTTAAGKALNKNLLDRDATIVAKLENELMPNKAVSITVDGAKDGYKVYMVKADGSVVDLGATFNANKVLTATATLTGPVIVTDKAITATAASTGTTTNPGTGANDVVGVAAALAVVALVSGAAISLKK